MLNRCRHLAAIVLMGVATATPLAAQEKTFDETREFVTGSLLALEARRGSVQLTSWDRDEIEIQVRIGPPPDVDEDYARRAVEGTAVEVRGNRRSLRIRANYSGMPTRGRLDRSRNLPRVHYDIRAPRAVDLDLDIDRSDTTLTGFSGRLLLDFDRSNVVARDLDGIVTIALERGSLEANGLTGSLALDVDRSDNIALEGVEGSLQLDADRSNVTMTATRLSDDSVVAIDRGDLDLGLIERQPLTIEADLSQRADFTSDLPLTLQGNGEEFTGLLNGGGPILHVTADRSTIRLRSR